jgi:hypothetical protein
MHELQLRVQGVLRQEVSAVDRCMRWRGASMDCPHRVFRSADGSTRCAGCHLHPDACTCGPSMQARLVWMLGLADSGRLAPAALRLPAPSSSSSRL